MSDDPPSRWAGASPRMYATPLGDAKPHPGGHWLKALSVLRDLRVWWSDTDAHEEYEDALLAEIAGRNDGRLPFANLAGSDGQAKASGLENSLTTDPAAGPARPAAVKQRSPRPHLARRRRRDSRVQQPSLRPSLRS